MKKTSYSTSGREHVRTLLFPGIFLLLICLSCTRSGNLKPDTLVITTSFYPVYIMALNITDGIPGVTLHNLTGPQTGCLHDYQLTTADMRMIHSSRIFIINGAGMESYLDKITGQIPGLTVIDSSHGVPSIRYAHNGTTNPHFFTSISGAIAQVTAMMSGLMKADPEHAEAYFRNGTDYIYRLAELKKKMDARLSGMAGTGIITFHEAFPYFADEFGLKIKGVITQEPGTDLNPRQLAEAIRMVTENTDALLFAEPQYPSRSANVIARETGRRMLMLDPAVTGQPDKNAYIRIMEKNLKILEDAGKE